jgi:hypothetical protein
MSSTPLRPARTGIALLLWAVAVSASAAPFAPVLDEFWILKDGQQIFRDSFDNGVPPPTGPDGPTTYDVYGPGGITSEASGKLTMTPALGDPTLITTTYAEVATQITRLLTTNSANPNFLGEASSFEIHSLYDMSNLPTVAGQGFSVRATDRAPALNNDGDNTFNLAVSVYAMGVHAGEIGVFLIKYDFSTNSSVVLWSDPIQSYLGGTDQIELILSKDAGSNQIDANYKLYDYALADPLVHTASVSDAGRLYVGEDYIRAAAIVSDRLPIPEPPTLALLGLGLAGLAAARRRRQ